MASALFDLRIFALLFLALAGTCLGSLPAELHWKSVLPDTEMPKSLQNLLQSGNKEFLNEMLKAPDTTICNHIFYCGAQSNFAGISKDVFFLEKYPYPGRKMDVFFFEKDLHPGRKIKALQFQKTPFSDIAFLPTQLAKKIPFSSDKLPEILKYFSLKTASMEEANVIKETIDICEAPPIGGESKFCATSLESMVDMAVAKLGKGVRILSTEVEKETQSREFTILEGVKPMGEKQVVCHKMKYPHAVFYCHSIEKTAFYRVPMVGSDGTRARAMAVCHKDTSSWNPNHWAFQLLKVKPGTVPVCHFLGREAITWLPKN